MVCSLGDVMTRSYSGLYSVKDGEEFGRLNLETLLMRQHSPDTSYGLEKKFSEGLYEDFEQLTLQFYLRGNLYGLEKYCPTYAHHIWCHSAGFAKTVETAWAAHFTGNPQFITNSKLRAVKAAIKVKLEDIQGQVQVNSLNQELAGLEISAVQELETAYKDHEDFHRLKARSQWLRLGERCTKLFHAVHRSRCNSNFIGAIQLENGELTFNPQQIKESVVNYFKQMYSADSNQRTQILTRQRLSEDSLAVLNEPFSFEELDAIVKDSDADKAPGPDGFTMAFYKEF